MELFLFLYWSSYPIVFHVFCHWADTTAEEIPNLVLSLDFVSLLSEHSKYPYFCGAWDMLGRWLANDCSLLYNAPRLCLEMQIEVQFKIRIVCSIWAVLLLWFCSKDGQCQEIVNGHRFSCWITTVTKHDSYDNNNINKHTFEKQKQKQKNKKQKKKAQGITMCLYRARVKWPSVRTAHGTFFRTLWFSGESDLLPSIYPQKI